MVKVELPHLTHNREEATSFKSKSIIQDMLIPNDLRGKNGASQPEVYKSKSYIYFWQIRWDGSVESLACRFRRPHSHPKQHTEAELK